MTPNCSIDFLLNSSVRLTSVAVANPVDLNELSVQRERGRDGPLFARFDKSNTSSAPFSVPRTIRLASSSVPVSDVQQLEEKRGLAMKENRRDRIRPDVLWPEQRSNGKGRIHLAQSLARSHARIEECGGLLERESKSKRLEVCLLSWIEIRSSVAQFSVESLRTPR